MYLLPALAAGLVRCVHIDRLHKLSEGIGGQFREGAVPLYPLNKLLYILCLLFLFMDLLLQILDLDFESFLFLGVVLAHHGKAFIIQPTGYIVLVNADEKMNRPPFVRQYGILLTNGVLFMPKGVPNKRYTGEFKQEVVETMQREKLSHKEVARLYGITAHDRVASWERIYLEEGPEGLYIERRGRGSKGSPPKKLKPEVEEDLLAEVQRLRAENAYLKKLNALVAERVRQERKQK